MSIAEKIKQSIPFLNEDNFIDSSLIAFDYQYQHNPIYHSYCNYLSKTPKSVDRLEDIPFLPIEFFKNHAIKSGDWNSSKIFKSSGTTSSTRSEHAIKDLDFYHQTAKNHFEDEFGNLNELQIIALLPSYQEQGDSSLISMIDYFMQFSAKGSGYYLGHEIGELMSGENKKLLFGVSYALLDLAEHNQKLNNTFVMETGGMKGRRREMTRNELHNILKNSFGVEKIWSEYGMTELQSQGYGANGQFKLPVWAKCLIRDINDPFNYVQEDVTGGINVIDLVNIDTCCFIETKDLGRQKDGFFEVLGRFDNSDIRGCNLMI